MLAANKNKMIEPGLQRPLSLGNNASVTPQIYGPPGRRVIVHIKTVNAVRRRFLGAICSTFSKTRLWQMA
jgi:hypothetical protein